MCLSEAGVRRKRLAQYGDHDDLEHVDRVGVALQMVPQHLPAPVPPMEKSKLIVENYISHKYKDNV